MNIKKITGMVAASFTPTKENGDPDSDRIPELANYIINQGIKGIYVCGSTGEGPSLTSFERKAVAECFVKAIQKRVPVMVHVGHNSIKEAQDLANHAQLIGADYVSAVAPSYFKLSSAETLVKALAEIAAGAPGLPFYYYHIPRLTGLNIDMIDVLQYAERNIPTFAGIKFTSASLDEYQACLNATGRKYDMLYGTDEMLLGALAVGAKGYIGSTYNFLAPLYRQIRESFDNNDIAKARSLQWKSVQIIRIITRYGGLAPQKLMMKFLGIDCGGVRNPLQQLTKDQEASFKNELDKAGFFDVIAGIMEAKN